MLAELNIEPSKNFRFSDGNIVFGNKAQCSNLGATPGFVFLPVSGHQFGDN